MKQKDHRATSKYTISHLIGSENGSVNLGALCASSHILNKKLFDEKTPPGTENSIVMPNSLESFLQWQEGSGRMLITWRNGEGSVYRIGESYLHSARALHDRRRFDLNLLCEIFGTFELNPNKDAKKYILDRGEVFVQYVEGYNSERQGFLQVYEDLRMLLIDLNEELRSFFQGKNYLIGPYWFLYRPTIQGYGFLYQNFLYLTLSSLDASTPISEQSHDSSAIDLWNRYTEQQRHFLSGEKSMRNWHQTLIFGGLGDLFPRAKTHQNFLCIILDKAITNMHNNLEKIEPEHNDEKIKEIIKFIRIFLVVHPFYDYNCRTAVITLNHLLQEYGMSPTIMIQHDLLLAGSVDTLLEVIKSGQNKFEKLCDANAEYDGDVPDDRLSDIFGITWNKSELTPEQLILLSATKTQTDQFKELSQPKSNVPVSSPRP